MPYRKQGDAEMLTADALRRRSALRGDSGVAAVVERLWAAAPKCPPPHGEAIDRQIYQWLALRVGGAVPRCEQAEVAATVDEDWWAGELDGRTGNVPKNFVEVVS